MSANLSSRLSRVCALLGMSLLAICFLGALPATSDPLEVGQAAPAFSLQGSDGTTYTLASILASGKEGVVLAWFPKAFTPG